MLNYFTTTTTTTKSKEEGIIITVITIGADIMRGATKRFSEETARRHLRSLLLTILIALGVIIWHKQGKWHIDRKGDDF